MTDPSPLPDQATATLQASAPDAGSAASPAAADPAPAPMAAPGAASFTQTYGLMQPSAATPAAGGAAGAAASAAAAAAAVPDPVIAAILATDSRTVRVRGLAGMLLAPYSLAFLALLIGTGYLATRYGIPALAFNAQAFLNVTQVMAPLFLVSAFVERAVEVILTGVRGDEGDRLAAEVGHAAAAVQAAPSPQTMRQLKELQHMLIQFKSVSRELAFLLSTGLGIAAALCGIRGLAGLLSSSPPQTPSPAFTTLDILLTGIVIGGGADGIHKIVQAVLDFVQSIPSGKGG